MKSKLFAYIAAFTLSIGLFSSIGPAVHAANTKEVKADTLTVRSGPSVGYKAIKWLKKGTTVTVNSTSNGWDKITYKGGSGYVSNKYLKTVSTPVVKNATASSIKGETNYVTAKDGLNLRTGRVFSAKLLTTIPYQAEVTVSDVKNGWGYVVYGNVKGYSNVSYLSKLKPTTTVPKVVNGILKGKKIAIDPGHGGKFPGAQGYVDEEDVNLQIALKVQKKLEELGAVVVMTRTNDTHLKNKYTEDLAARPAFAKANKASMFISIHANSGTPTAYGAETFYYNATRGDQKLAKAIFAELVSTGEMKGRAAKYGNYSVLRNSGMVSTLVETGFVTNRSDAAKLGSATHQNKLAQAITNGIVNYYK